MTTARTPPDALASKAASGTLGFDEITGGGLPRGRTTLLAGGAGSGKTVFALQFLAQGIHACKEPGIFVAFEESSKSLMTNAASFGWKLTELQRRKKLLFIDAQPQPDMVQSGDFDLGGLLAVLQAQITAMGAQRIVFDALDIVLELLPDATARRREIYRLHAWLKAQQLTGIITSKSGGGNTDTVIDEAYGLMQFMVDCAVVLNQTVVQGVSQRNLRVVKFRGSGFEENETPFLISQVGIDVALARAPGHAQTRMTNERVSSGIGRLDTMLEGGYYRGASVLITGFSGTAKTTLSGAFAEAACLRGESTLFVSFDSDAHEVIRNLASIGIRLQRFVKTGLLHIISARSITGSAETYLMRVKTLVRAHATRCLIIDPISIWSHSGTDAAAPSVADRLIDWSKASGITLVSTRLLDEMSSRTDGSTPLQISTLVDTWIHLSYLVQAGERNRALSIIKSRGTAHSNQVRELILSDTGVTLTDAYTAGGEVLMGTMRWEKERSERLSREAGEASVRLKRVHLEAEEAELEVRLKSLQTELIAKQSEKALLADASQAHAGELKRGRTRIGELRGVDTAADKPG